MKKIIFLFCCLFVLMTTRCNTGSDAVNDAWNIEAYSQKIGTTKKKPKISKQKALVHVLRTKHTQENSENVTILASGTPVTKIKPGYHVYFYIRGGWHTFSARSSGESNMIPRPVADGKEYYLRVLFRGSPSNGPKIKEVNAKKAKRLLQWDE